ncbi:hypothetical protein K438DRAFT_1779887 [Mycena galopus ATCC 62051]|nr:hypothetical protein K438DRAFT_1779887 [Mycena galopus ATCC 62051]
MTMTDLIFLALFALNLALLSPRSMTSSNRSSMFRIIRQWVKRRLSAVCFFTLWHVTCPLYRSVSMVTTFGIVYHGWFAIIMFLSETSTYSMLIPAGQPYFNNGACKGKVLHLASYYSAHMVFDLIACATATYYLPFLEIRAQCAYRWGRIFLGCFLANLWVALEFAHVFVSGAASSLPLALVLIGPPRFYSQSRSQQLDVELQQSSLFNSETAVEPRKVSFHAKNKETKVLP